MEPRLLLAAFSFPTQAQLGNVFQTGQSVQIPMKVSTGDSVHWTVRDFYGNPVASGVAPVAGGNATVSPGISSLGWYELQLSAWSGGNPVSGATGETTFAVLAPATASAGRPASGTQFGVQGHFANGWNTGVIPLIAKAGIGYVRDEQWWQNVEPWGGGHFVWPGTFTNYMAALQANDIRILQEADFGNSNYDGGHAPYSSNGRDAFARYADALVGRYGSQIQLLEVWNEYNGTWCSGPALNDRAYYYTEMLKETYNKVKASNPDVTILGGAAVLIPLGYYDRMFQLGALDYMDGLVIHPYEAETPYTVEQEIAALNEMMLAHAGRTVPIYVTEFALNTNPTQGFGQQNMATYMVQMLTSLQSQDVRYVSWYNLQDNGGQDTWLLARDDDPRGAYVPNSAYVADSNYIQQMAGASFNGLWSSTDPRTRVYSFARAGESVNIAYSTSGLTTLQLVADEPLTVVDIMGKSTTYTPSNGKVTLTNIGETPIFIRGPVTDVYEVRGDVLLADSMYDYRYTASPGQDQDGWYFGYANNPNGWGGSYNPSSFVQSSWTLQDNYGYHWTNSAQFNTISQSEQQPTNGRWSIRRWVSSTTAPATISSTLSLTSSQGDGVVYQVLINGSPVMTQQINSTTPTTFTLNVNLNAGDIVDFALTSGPNNNQNYDATKIHISITSPVPSSPRDLVGTADSFSQVTLNWVDTSSTENGFIIERNSGPGGAFVQIASVPANTTSYVDKGLSANTTYVYRVHAFNASGPSLQYASAFVTTAGEQLADSVTGYSSTQGSGGWQYGYYLPSTTSFQQMSEFDTGQQRWNGPESFHFVSQERVHPGQTLAAVRRWTASRGGTVLVTGHAAKINVAGGNGVFLSVLKNGAIVWSQTLAHDDAAGFDYAIPLTIQAGDTIAFCTQAIGGDNSYDETSFTAQIVTIPLADSVNGFSPTQALGGWRYGYYAPGTTNFSQSESYDPGGALWQGPETYHQVWADGGHPGATYSAVRRWTSSVAGPITITGHFAKQNPYGGNGVIVSILHNGNTVWNRTLPHDDITGDVYAIHLNVSMFDSIDFEIRSVDGNNAFDATEFTARITTAPLTDSRAAFSSIQGANGWYYGYYDPVTQAFHQSSYSGDLWQGPEPYNQLWDQGGHPGSMYPSVRRWVSNFTGPVSISGLVAKEDISGGNGVMVSILHNGTLIWSHTLAYNDSSGLDYRVLLDITEGDTLDFRIESVGQNNDYDATTFTALISRQG